MVSTLEAVIYTVITTVTLSDHTFIRSIKNWQNLVPLKLVLLQNAVHKFLNQFNSPTLCVKTQKRK